MVGGERINNIWKKNKEGYAISWIEQIMQQHFSFVSIQFHKINTV